MASNTFLGLGVRVFVSEMEKLVSDSRGCRVGEMSRHGQSDSIVLGVLQASVNVSFPNEPSLRSVPLPLGPGGTGPLTSSASKGPYIQVAWVQMYACFRSVTCCPIPALGLLPAVLHLLLIWYLLLAIPRWFLLLLIHEISCVSMLPAPRA